MSEEIATNDIMAAESAESLPDAICDMGDAAVVIDILKRHDWRATISFRDAVAAIERHEDYDADLKAEMINGLVAGPHTGVEVGVHRGATSALLLREFPALTLAMVDPWACYPAEHPYRQSGDGCSKFTWEQQDENYRAALAATEFAAKRRRVLKMPSVRAAERWVVSRLSFCFVDGDHRYEAVAQDIASWWPRIEAGGILCGHDIDHPRDRRGVWGVRRAVEEFAAREQVQFQQEGTVWYVTKQPAN